MNKKKIEISVILPVYNGSKYIEESISSILEQSIENFELIILNDGSTDDSLQKCELFKKRDSRIKVINQSNIGLTKTLNKGIKLSTGTYLARQDADDISRKDRFENQLSWIKEKNSRVLCGTNTTIIDKDGKEKKNKIISFKHKNIIEKFEYTNCIAHSSALFLKSAAEEVGNYDENLTYSQDYDLWWKLSTIGEIGNLKEKLVILRETIDSISHKKSSDQFKDFINSALKYFAIKNNINGVKLSSNIEHIINLKEIQNQKKILEFLYNDKIKNETYFNDLNLKQKFLSLKYFTLYLRKILK